MENLEQKTSMEIVEIKCDGCGMMRKWRGYECLTYCDCLADKPEDQSNLLDAQVSGIYYDKNGVEITDGCTIYNEWDRDQYHKIVKNENGELCFATDMTVLDKRYATDRFWKVVNSR